jgi:hypothetical protein
MVDADYLASAAARGRRLTGSIVAHAIQDKSRSAEINAAQKIAGETQKMCVSPAQ